MSDVKKIPASELGTVVGWYPVLVRVSSGWTVIAELRELEAAGMLSRWYAARGQVSKLGPPTEGKVAAPE